MQGGSNLRVVLVLLVVSLGRCLVVVLGGRLGLRLRGRGGGLGLGLLFGGGGGSGGGGSGGDGGRGGGCVFVKVCMWYALVIEI